jgi:predicted GNAT family acetyltransferase
MDFKHEETESKGAFSLDQDGKKVAELTYSKAGPNKIIIDHTEVSDVVKGQGIGKKIVVHAVEFARENNLKVLPLCPFAKSVISRNPELQDVT